MRILMLAPTPYFADRGCHVRIYEEARALRAAGHEIRIATYHLGRDMSDIPVTRIRSVPWYTRLEAGPSWHKIYLDAMLLCTAAPLVSTFRPNIIHAHLHEGAAIGYLLKKLFSVPLVFDYQGSLSGECIDHGFFTPTSLTARTFRGIERTIDRCADRIVTSSSAGATELVSNWGMAPDKVVPVIDGVDTDTFHPYPRHEARQRLAIPPGVPVIAYLGVLNRYQGIDLLLDCIGILKEQRVSTHFLLMGFPCERYRAEATARGIDDMITFTGKVDYGDAPVMLSAADIAVSPKLSPTEANGKLFNYMACGLPTVAFDTPVNREVLGAAGIYVPYADSDALAATFIDLLNEPTARERYATLARERAVSEHSWKARGEQLTEIYRALQKQQVSR